MTAFAADQLRERIRVVSEQARASGHLWPIQTAGAWFHDRGMDFLIRTITHLARKPSAAASSGARNPFLPYEPELFVTDVSDSHVALLNKFQVVDGHLLLVTREYQPQETRLSTADFQALAHCLIQYDSLGFYNSSKIAGASQPHRHLQLIPVPLADGGPAIPVETCLELESMTVGMAKRSSRLPFTHQVFKIEPVTTEQDLGDQLTTGYTQLVRNQEWSEVSAQTPYNLLMTRQWMMLVPRRRECFGEISLNAMAYAGALLVRHEQQQQQLIQAGPMQALIETT